MSRYTDFKIGKEIEEFVRFIECGQKSSRKEDIAGVDFWVGNRAYDVKSRFCTPYRDIIQLELSYVTGNGVEKPGWFVDKNKITTDYIFGVRAMFSEKDKEVIGVWYVSIPKESIKEMVLSNGSKYKTYRSNRLKEKPLNLAVPLRDVIYNNEAICKNAVFSKELGIVRIEKYTTLEDKKTFYNEICHEEDKNDKFY